MLLVSALMRKYPEETAFNMMMRHGSQLLLRAEHRAKLGLPPEDLERKTPVTYYSSRNKPYTRKKDRNHLPPSGRPKVIMEAAADLLGVTVGDILGPSRKKPIKCARWIAMKVLRDLKNPNDVPVYSTTRIGAIFQRDHSSVCHALSTFDVHYKHDEKFRTAYDELRRRYVPGDS